MYPAWWRKKHGCTGRYMFIALYIYTLYIYSFIYSFCIYFELYLYCLYGHRHTPTGAAHTDCHWTKGSRHNMHGSDTKSSCFWSTSVPLPDLVALSLEKLEAWKLGQVATWRGNSTNFFQGPSIQQPHALCSGYLLILKYILAQLDSTHTHSHQPLEVCCANCAVFGGPKTTLIVQQGISETMSACKNGSAVGTYCAKKTHQSSFILIDYLLVLLKDCCNSGLPRRQVAEQTPPSMHSDFRKHTHDNGQLPSNRVFQ